MVKLHDEYFLSAHNDSFSLLQLKHTAGMEPDIIAHGESETVSGILSLMRRRMLLDAVSGSKIKTAQEFKTECSRINSVVDSLRSEVCENDR